MSEATELLENMEKAGHGGGHGHGHGDGKPGPQKAIGVTMALLGVMLALCAAMVGSARTELIKTTVEQSNKWGVYQSESTKFRVIEADVEMLHALTPSKAELGKFEQKLGEVKSRSGKGDDEDTAEMKDAIHVSTVELADVLTPDKEDEDRLAGIGAKYKRDMAEAKEDAEAYDVAIEAYQEAAEGFEHAQLCAEIGIVIASIALLMASRKVWYVAVVIGLFGAAFVGKSYYDEHGKLSIAEKKIADAQNNAVAIEKDDDDDDAASGSVKKDDKAAPEKKDDKAAPEKKDDKAAPEKKDDKAAPEKKDDKAAPPTSAQPDPFGGRN
jgi:Domain of unknown function (DUF4337)